MNILKEGSHNKLIELGYREVMSTRFKYMKSGKITTYISTDNVIYCLDKEELKLLKDNNLIRKED